MSRNRQQQNGRRPGKKRYSRLRCYKQSILMICTVLVFLTGALAIGSAGLHSKLEGYKEQEKELQAQIDEEEQRSKEIDEYEEYVRSDQYIKDTAEDKLGLVDPGEIVFKPSN